MQRSERLVPLLAAAVLAAGCDTGGGGDPDVAPDTTPTEFACEVGLPEGGGFEALAPGGGVELQLGFQGFLVVEVAVRVPGGAPDAPVAKVSLTLDGEEPTGLVQGALAMHEAADGSATTEPLVVFLTPANVAYFEGREARLAVKLEGRVDGAPAACTVTDEVLLVDEDPCIHTGEEPLCPGDEGWEEAAP